MKEKLKKWIKEKYGDSKVVEVGDWTRPIEMSTIARAIEWYKNENQVPFEQIVTELACENMQSTYDLYDAEEEVIKQFLKENSVTECDEDMEYDLIEELHNYLDFDFGITQRLQLTKPEECNLYFGANWDDDYNKEIVWETVLEKSQEQILTVPEIEIATQKSVITWFLRTQGYSPHDLACKHKREKSELLQSIYDEITEYGPSGLQLVARVYTEDWNLIADIEAGKRKGVTLDKNVTFGLFNPVHGRGSLFGIQSEKEIDLTDAPISEITFQTANESFNYSPDIVYGFMKNRKTSIKRK